MEESVRELLQEERAYDFASLSGADEYARYFNQLSLVFGLLRSYFSKIPEVESFEIAAVTGYLERLLYTIKALRLKYTYTSDLNRSLWVDLTESGFPNSAEISNLNTDLVTRDGRLQGLPSAAILKRGILDYLLTRGAEPRMLLCQMSERAYFELLDPERLFLTYNQGNLARSSDNAKTRSYVVSWASYDFQRNRPYIYILSFEQDALEQPLEEEGPRRHELLEVLRSEGSHTPTVGVVAAQIDDAIESIHPKLLKRLGIGPLYSHLLLKERGGMSVSDPRESVVRELLLRTSKYEHDFVLFFTQETIFSHHQEVKKVLLGLSGTRTREIFFIPESEPECYERRASMVGHHVLLPHLLLQHIGKDVEAKIPRFKVARKITYTEKGAMYAI